MRSRTTTAALIGAGLLAALPLARASAAPQMLGLVASNTPVELNCAGDTCIGQFTAFCLEQDREVPKAGTAYLPVDTAPMTVVLTTGTGRQIELPAGDILRYSAGRGYSNVFVSLDRSAFAAHKPVKVALHIGRDMSLVPAAVAGDARPHTSKDIARAAGPLRQIGSRVVDQGGPTSDAARLMNRMLNALPRSGRMSSEDRATAWERTLGTKSGSGKAALGYKAALGQYEFCQQKVAQGRVFSLRSCIESQHDSLMTGLNRKYWDSAHPGM